MVIRGRVREEALKVEYRLDAYRRRWRQTRSITGRRVEHPLWLFRQARGGGFPETAKKLRRHLWPPFGGPIPSARAKGAKDREVCDTRYNVRWVA